METPVGRLLCLDAQNEAVVGGLLAEGNECLRALKECQVVPVWYDTFWARFGLGLLVGATAVIVLAVD